MPLPEFDFIVPVNVPLLCVLKEPMFNFIVLVIVPALSSKLEIYSAPFISSERPIVYIYSEEQNKPTFWQITM